MVSVIIVAAGKGTRMGAATRKQYLSLSGVPIVGITLGVFDGCDAIQGIFLVIPENDFDFCRDEVLVPLNLQNRVTLVPGGATRQDSVYKGLSALDDPGGIVLIHDGVRPFVRHEEIMACIRAAEADGACILGLPAFDTLKGVNAAGYIEQTFERAGVWLAQTPQAFQYELICRAHESAIAEGFTGTDDASLVERMGKAVRVISGSRYNIKITTPEDLRIAAATREFFQ